METSVAKKAVEGKVSNATGSNTKGERSGQTEIIVATPFNSKILHPGRKRKSTETSTQSSGSTKRPKCCSPPASKPSGSGSDTWYHECTVSYSAINSCSIIGKPFLGEVEQVKDTLDDTCSSLLKIALSNGS